MKAAFFRKTGSPSVIEWGELPDPKLGDDDLLVKTTAVAANHVDTYIRSGHYPLDKPLPNPFIIGSDLVGVVEKVGKNVRDFKPSQRVWANTLGFSAPQGSFSEFVAASARLFYPVPNHVGDLEMVAAVHSGATACAGLIRVAQIRTSDIIFVNGGAGNIGSAVIQLAAARGARVFASSSFPEKIDWCKKWGAEQVFDYKNPNMEQELKKAAPDGVDIYWDTSRNPHFDLAVSILKKRGQIVLMAGGQARPPFPVGPFFRKECRMEGFTLKQVGLEEMREYAQIINRCLEENKLEIKIAEVLPVAESAKAHEMLENKPDLWGKIILKF